jgi:hypothetical protein
VRDGFNYVTGKNFISDCQLINHSSSLLIVSPWILQLCSKKNRAVHQSFLAFLLVFSSRYQRFWFFFFQLLATIGTNIRRWFTRIMDAIQKPTAPML